VVRARCPATVALALGLIASLAAAALTPGSGARAQVTADPDAWQADAFGAETRPTD
jgi:hypothetical protein